MTSLPNLLRAGLIAAKRKWPLRVVHENGWCRFVGIEQLDRRGLVKRRAGIAVTRLVVQWVYRDPRGRVTVKTRLRRQPT